MLKHFVRLAGLTTLLGVMIAPSAHAAQVRVGVQMGGRSPVVAGPPYGARVVALRGYWQPGHFVWTPYGRRWVPGMWVSGHIPRGRAYGYWRNRGWDRDDRRWRR